MPSSASDLHEPDGVEDLAQASLVDMVKTIGDLDSVVQGLLSMLPSSKPWQRQARSHLTEADRSMQVLRLAISLERGRNELVDAARDLQLSMRAATAFIFPARSEQRAKFASKLGADLADKLYGLLASSS